MRNILIFLLSLPVLTFGQVSPKVTYNITSPSHTFGANLPVGSLVTDVNTFRLYSLKASSTSSGTINTTSKIEWCPMVPTVDGGFEFGSSNYRWHKGYFNYLDVKTGLQMNGRRIGNVGYPVDPTDAVNKLYADGFGIGVKKKPPANEVAVDNITLADEQYIDGVLTDEDTVLVIGQTDKRENGMYVTKAKAWERLHDMDEPGDFAGSIIEVTGGERNANKKFMVMNTNSVNVGTDDVNISAYVQDLFSIDKTIIGFGARIWDYPLFNIDDEHYKVYFGALDNDTVLSVVSLYRTRSSKIELGYDDATYTAPRHSFSGTIDAARISCTKPNVQLEIDSVRRIAFTDGTHRQFLYNNSDAEKDAEYQLPMFSGTLIGDKELRPIIYSACYSTGDSIILGDAFYNLSEGRHFNSITGRVNISAPNLISKDSIFGKVYYGNGSKSTQNLLYLTNDANSTKDSSVIVTPKGIVGIGTTSPATGYQLDVVGNINTAQTVNQNTYPSVNASQTAATLQDGSSYTGTDITMSTQYIATKIVASGNHTMGDYCIRIKASATLTNYTNYIAGYLYSDNSGVPGSNLATGNQIRFGSLTTSYQSLSVGTSYTLTQGATYWLVLMYDAPPTGGDIVLDGATLTGSGATSTGSGWTATDNVFRYVLRGKTYHGVSGTSTNSYGVQGYSTNSYGVQGYSTNNIGVYGNSTNYYGVYGSSTNSYGVYGSSTNNIGVYCSSTNNIGVLGSSINSYGVYGASTNHFGVFGESTNSYAVYGTSTNNIGVLGSSINSYGVYGNSTNYIGGVFYIAGELSQNNSYNTVLIRRNPSGNYNVTGNVLQITDNPTSTGTISGSLISGQIDATTRLDFNPRVVDGASAVAYFSDTKNALSTTGAKLWSFRNSGVEKASIDHSGGASFGDLTLRNLAGSGNRTVEADENGMLKDPTSDQRLKENIEPLKVDYLGMLRDTAIQAITYSWKDKLRGTGKEVGFTAQMFEPYNIPNLTGTMKVDGSKYLNYDRITVLLWEQNKALLKKIESLEERIDKIEKRLK